MEPTYRVFVVNPGSTATRLALFRCTAGGDRLEIEEALSADPIRGRVIEALPARLGDAMAFLERHGVTALDAVVGRGGLIRPVPSGTIRVDPLMEEDARAGCQGEHASNLGCLIAAAVASRFGVPAFVVDPVAVDEMLPLARYTGLPAIRRRSLAHALNVKAAARLACERLGRTLADSRFVVAHLGGGFSIVPVDGGRLLDANNANSGGPFTPTRAGSLPTQDLIRLCFTGEFPFEDLKRLTTREGGLRAHLGTDDAREVEARIAAGDDRAREVYEAMAYQTAKAIGAMATVLCGRLDAVVLTGGLAHSDLFCGWLTERIGFLGPILRCPGEFEMLALAAGARRALSGEEPALDYAPEQTLVCGTPERRL